MLRFQRIQSTFSFKLNILSSKRFLNSPGVNSATKRLFCRPFSVAFARGENKFSARFVADAFIDHICRIKDMSCEPVSVEPIKRLEIYYP